MPNCFTCQTEFKFGDAFCSKCGRSLKKKADRDKKTNSSQQEYIPPQPTKLRYPHDDLSITMRKQKEKRKKWAIIVAALLSPISLFFIYCAFAEAFNIFYLVIVGLVNSIPLYMMYRGTSETEYYSLPGSMVDGQHRCVFCGHKGLYKKGEYKSNRVTASCTGCQSLLFVTTN